MNRHFCLSLCLAFLLCCVPLRAQWSGSADLSGGLGGMKGSEITEYKPMFHGLVQGSFKLNYQTEKFSWTTTLTGKWEPKTTDNRRMAYKNERLGVVYKAATTQPLTTSLRSDFLWKPDKDRNYTAWILYQYKNDRARNHSMDYGVDLEDNEKFSYYYELPVLDELKVETGLRTYRSFDSGRKILQSSFMFQTVGNRRVNTWIVFKTEEEEGATAIDLDDDITGYAWMYRITPRGQDYKTEGDIHLQMTALDGTARLKYAPGLRLSSNHAMDENSGATRINMTEAGSEGIWRDSTRLRETFNYLSILAEPYLSADFNWESLEAHANYACQVYARRLNDDTHQQPLKIKGVYPVGKANVKWTISPRHSLNLTNQLSVSHPDYLKICWYDRSAGYLDQLYRGNEKLLSPWTQRYGLEYEFKWKRFFTQTTLSYTNVQNEIDQTWSNEEIEGRQYKVFRWINSSDSHSLGLSEKLGWRGKIITANLGLTYNQNRRKAKTGDTVKKSFDWRLNADVSANLGKGWSMGVNAKYQSKVATFFTIFKEYCELNASIQKEFKHITLYLEGRDLLDQPAETSFESEELQEFWVEEVRNNRRIFVLGARWKF
jgi:hypothetical protein